MSVERDVNTIVSEISSKGWKVRDLMESATAEKTRSEGVALTKDQAKALKDQCKILCDEMKVLCDELKAKIR